MLPRLILIICKVLSFLVKEDSRFETDRQLIITKLMLIHQIEAAARGLLKQRHVAR